MDKKDEQNGNTISAISDFAFKKIADVALKLPEYAIWIIFLASVGGAIWADGWLRMFSVAGLVATTIVVVASCLIWFVGLFYVDIDR